MSQLNIRDTNTVNLTDNGDVLEASVVIDPVAGNQLTSSASGLFVGSTVHHENIRVPFMRVEDSSALTNFLATTYTPRFPKSSILVQGFIRTSVDAFQSADTEQHDFKMIGMSYLTFGGITNAGLTNFGVNTVVSGTTGDEGIVVYDAGLRNLTVVNTTGAALPVEVNAELLQAVVGHIGGATHTPTDYDWWVQGDVMIIEHPIP